MNRRYWPTALGLLTAAILGWYLFYTQLLAREMRRSAEVNSRVYASILAGLQNPVEGSAEKALLDAIGEVQNLGIPIVVTDADGYAVDMVNLPFEADPNTPEGQARLQEYMRGMARQNSPIVEPGIGVVLFGDPPLVRRLQWIPWLQVGALVGILATAFWMVRHNQRVERERIWAAMARESAHQMGTPLSSLEGWVEILRLPPEEREELASLPAVAAEMEADLERLNKVSRRFEWIGRPVRREAVDVELLLRSLERYVRVRLPRLAGGVELHIDIPSGLPPVLGNAILLEWALENLVKNALDALAGAGGQITVQPEQQANGRVAIYVADNGPGVPPELRSTIFDPGVTSKAGGWGVGLSLARRIVEDVHRGELVLLPTEQGATFLITLPVAPQAATAPAATSGV